MIIDGVLPFFPYSFRRFAQLASRVTSTHQQKKGMMQQD